mgnify:FL=1
MDRPAIPHTFRVRLKQVPSLICDTGETFCPIFRNFLPSLHQLYICYHWAKIALIWISIAFSLPISLRCPPPRMAGLNVEQTSISFLPLFPLSADVTTRADILFIVSDEIDLQNNRAEMELNVFFSSLCSPVQYAWQLIKCHRPWKGKYSLLFI